MSEIGAKTAARRASGGGIFREFSSAQEHDGAGCGVTTRAQVDHQQLAEELGSMAFEDAEDDQAGDERSGILLGTARARMKAERKGRSGVLSPPSAANSPPATMFSLGTPSSRANANASRPPLASASASANTSARHRKEFKPFMRSDVLSSLGVGSDDGDLNGGGDGGDDGGGCAARNDGTEALSPASDRSASVPGLALSPKSDSGRQGRRMSDAIQLERRGKSEVLSPPSTLQKLKLSFRVKP
mmetsp:Transcript_5174/g.13890  ORF Transcript_5174/g.13890 Transcript_5174/m.13890 type:complete len:244 (-) Transcript_5174:385-1116(-)